jgi:predicted nucleic acid-binding Zn ribbon protein
MGGGERMGMGSGRRSRQYNPGRWQVQRERARIADTRPPSAFADAAPIDGVIAGVLKRLGLESQQWMATLAAGWEGVVGAAVARHTRPGRYDGRALVIFVDNSVWLSEIKRCGTAQILANIQRLSGPGRVSAVRFELDPDGAPARPDAGRRSPQP